MRKLGKVSFAVLIVSLLFCAWLEVSFLRLDLTKYDTPWLELLPSNVPSNFSWDGVRPLRFAFFVWGSRGDHQPNIALGLELARRGHVVSILGRHKYRHLIEQHSGLLRYVPFDDPHLDEFSDRVAKSSGEYFVPLTRDYAVRSARTHVEQYLKAAEDADVLFGQQAITVFMHQLTAAQAARKPLILLTHDQTLPTSETSFNPKENRVRDYGRRTNVFNHRLLTIAFGAMLTASPWSVFRAIRSELGLSTPWPFMSFLSPEKLADFPVISTSDPVLWSPPKDHPAHWHATGYFVTRSESGVRGDDDNDASSHEKLQRWIDERKKMGRSLVYFGQGSFDHHDQNLYADILRDALKELGTTDAIALNSTVGGDCGGGSYDDDDDYAPVIRVVPYLNQDVVFPQCDVIVHHGGAGSASQCIRSGRPGLCIPSMPFQEIWGGNMEDYGVGMLLRPKDIRESWEGRLGGDNNQTKNLLARSLRRLLEDAETQRKAKELAKSSRRMSGGVEMAADKVLEHVHGLRRRLLATNKELAEESTEGEEL